MTKERLEELAATAVGENAEIYALARRGLEAEEGIYERQRYIADLRRACELAREYLRAEFRPVLPPHQKIGDDRDKVAEVARREADLRAALAAVGMPVKDVSLKDINEIVRKMKALPEPRRPWCGICGEENIKDIAAHTHDGEVLIWDHDTLWLWLKNPVSAAEPEKSE